jgi:hypothetical protein
LTNDKGAYNEDLTITRNYSNEQLILRATVKKGYFNPILSTSTEHDVQQDGGSLVGNPVKNYDFTVLANSSALIARRIEKGLEDWFDLLPQTITMPAAADITVTVEVIDPLMYQPTIVTSASNLTDDVPTLKYELEYKGTGAYYVLPATSGVAANAAIKVDSGLVSATTLDNVDFFVLFRRVDVDVNPGSGFANVEAGYTDGNMTSEEITIHGRDASANLLDLPILVLNANTGQLIVHENSQLVFPAEAGAVAELAVNIVGRILLSTDTVAATKEVNSRAVSHTLTLFQNPVFQKDSAEVVVSGVVADMGSGMRSIVVTLDTGGQFKQGSTIASSLVTVSGLGTSGVAVANAINASELTIVRESDRTIRIVGFSGTAINNIDFGTNANNKLLIEIARGAFRTFAAIATIEGEAQVGVAQIVGAPKLITLTSGVNNLSTSGVTFQIQLTGNTFKSEVTGELGSGVQGTNSGIRSAFKFQIGGSDLPTGSDQIKFSGLVEASDSGLLTVTVYGVRAAALARRELTITIPSSALTLGGSNIDVLTDADEGILTSRNKLEIAFLEE